MWMYSGASPRNRSSLGKKWGDFRENSCNGPIGEYKKDWAGVNMKRQDLGIFGK
jgi:hypothetical protein